MKKTTILMTVLVLTISLFTGCGCTRRDPNLDMAPTTEMTILPTNIPETTAPILPSTEPLTEPTIDETLETATVDTGDGITDNITGDISTGNTMN